MTFSHECFHLQTSETGACPRSKQIKKAWLDMRNILSNDTAIARPQHLSQLLRRLLPTAASAIRMAVGTGIRADSCYRLTAKSLDFGQNSHVQMLGPNDFDNLSKFKVASAFRVDLLISWELGVDFSSLLNITLPVNRSSRPGSVVSKSIRNGAPRLDIITGLDIRVLRVCSCFTASLSALNSPSIVGKLDMPWFARNFRPSNL